MSAHRADELTDAALRIVSRDGLGALSYRSLATESGWSVGAIQKTFPSKEAILAAVIDTARARVVAELAPPGDPSLRVWLVEMMMASLPLDDARRTTTIMSVAYADRAPFDESLAAQVKTYDEQIRDMLRRLLGRARAEGELAPDVDVTMLAHNLLAYVSGLAAQLLYDPAPDAEVRALVSAAVNGLVQTTSG